MSKTNQAGHYKILEFTLLNKSLNRERSMLGLIGSFNIVESMNNGAIRGSVTIFESYDILNEFPIRGQEFIRVVYSDFFDVEREEIYFVYSVDDISYGDEINPSFMKYTLHFTSPYKFLSENFRVQRVYKDSIAGTQLVSDYAKDAFDEYYQKPVEKLFRKKLKYLINEPTTNKRTFVVPKYTPEETMNFFTRNAYSDTNPLNNGMNPSQTFRFFEARDAFFFGTNEFMEYQARSSSDAVRGGGLIQRPILEYKRNYLASVTPESQYSAMTEILDINFGTRVNTIDNMVQGGYRKKIYEFNILTMNIDERVYDYSEEANHDPKLNPIHDKLFIQENMSKEKEIHIFRDYSGPGVSGGPEIRDDTHYRELYMSKTAHFYNHNMNTLNITVYGRNDLFAGSYIDVTLFKHAYQKTTEEEERLNGLYLVESVNSVFDGTVFKQNLKLTRGGINIS